MKTPSRPGANRSSGSGPKLSGMHWTIPGATGIATLRCQDAGDRWDEIWQRPHNQTAPADHIRQAS